MSVLDYIKDVFARPGLYAKFWIAFTTAGLNAIALSFPDQPMLPILINFAGAFGVFVVPNNK